MSFTNLLYTTLAFGFRRRNPQGQQCRIGDPRSVWQRPRCRGQHLDVDRARVGVLEDRPAAFQAQQDSLIGQSRGSRLQARFEKAAFVAIEARVDGGDTVSCPRITVYDVLDYLAAGMSEDEILEDFPDLTGDDIRACLAFAADRERRLASSPPAA